VGRLEILAYSAWLITVSGRLARLNPLDGADN
jgi:hypothetical protein